VAIKVNKMASKMPRFRKILSEMHYREGRALGKRTREKASELLRSTFSDAHIGFRKATVKTKTDVKKTAKGCIVEMHFFVADSRTGQPHEVWHVVNRGRKAGKVKKTFAFRPRSGGPRTTPRSLNLRPYQGEENDLVFVNKGAHLRAIEAREFYDTAMNKLLFSLFSSGRYRDWQVKNKEVNND